MSTKLDVLGKQGVLIAILTIVQFCFALFNNLWVLSGHESYAIITRNKRSIGIDDYDYGQAFAFENYTVAEPANIFETVIRSDYYDICIVAISGLGVLLSSLMIFGIFKKRKNLMAPWIVMFVLGVMFFIGQVSYAVAYDYFALEVQKVLQGLAYACLALYPVVMLFLQIRREEIENAKQQRQTQVSSVENQLKFNPYFMQTIHKA